MIISQKKNIIGKLFVFHDIVDPCIAKLFCKNCLIYNVMQHLPYKYNEFGPSRNFSK